MGRKKTADSRMGAAVFIWKWELQIVDSLLEKRLADAGRDLFY